MGRRELLENKDKPRVSQLIGDVEDDDNGAV